MISWPGPITALLAGVILGLTLWTPVLRLFLKSLGFVE
jgi:hypothetical protein